MRPYRARESRIGLSLSPCLVRVPAFPRIARTAVLRARFTHKTNQRRSAAEADERTHDSKYPDAASAGEPPGLEARPRDEARVGDGTEVDDLGDICNGEVFFVAGLATSVGVRCFGHSAHRRVRWRIGKKRSRLQPPRSLIARPERRF